MRWHRKPEFRMLIFMGIMALLVIAGSVAIFLVAFPSLTGAVTHEDSNSAPSENIKIGTFAVCEEKDSFTICEDKIFASCNKLPVEVKNGVFECNNRTYNLGEAQLGKTYLLEDWSDPRPSGTITAWAASE